MTTRPAAAPQPPEAPPTPWWRVGFVWLVFGGPAVVVLASIVTVVIAVRGADTLVNDRPRGTATPGAATPAIEARNHAATPKP